LVRPLLPFIATQQLTDHHCHGVLRSGGDLDGLLNEADGDAARDGLAFDTLAGMAFRRWCPPLLGLPAHSSVADYRAQREASEAAELTRRFLQAAGLSAVFVDPGYTPGALLSPAEMAEFAGAAAFEVVRLEQVAEALGADGVGSAAFPDAYRAALAERVKSPSFGVPVAGVKSIAAYRVGLALDARRPRDAEVVAAAARWLAGGTEGTGGTERTGGTGRAGGTPSRLADETLHRFFIWCGAELGLPIQFHVGYGDRDIDLHRCNPLLLTELLRALEPTGAPVLLLHNYPYHREAGYLAQVFPNVYADLG